MAATTVTPTGFDLDPGVAQNIAALTPCPVCGADALRSPEGWGRAHIPHCWKCGYNWTKPAPTSINAPAVPSLAPAQVASLAEAVVARLQAAGWTPPAGAIDANSTTA